jgi:hypothetical protein
MNIFGVSDLGVGKINSVNSRKKNKEKEFEIPSSKKASGWIVYIIWFFLGGLELSFKKSNHRTLSST